MIDFCVRNLDASISKSRIAGEQWIFRGVFELSWLENPRIDYEFTEKAFGSFSLNLKHAQRYTNPKNTIIFQLKLNNTMAALYVDETEEEVIRPRETRYRITNVKIIENINNTTQIYTIEEV